VKALLIATLAFLGAAFGLPQSHGAAPYAGRLGVEASGDAFVDLAKQNYRWEKADGHGGWSKLTRADVDEHGWPDTDCHWVIDFRPCAEWAGQIDDPQAYRVDRSGTYHGSFLGAATLSATGGGCTIQNQSYNERANRTSFDLVVPKPGPNYLLLVLGFADTRRSPLAPVHSGISDFRLIRPGYPADTQQVFTSDYLSCLSSAAFSTIRFMAVTGTNGNVAWGRDHTNLQHWSDRKLPEDASVEAIEPLNKKDGWPWEYTVALCNQAGMDMWINIPMSVDDEYIRNLAQLLHAQLKPALHIYIEHSNEVWNFGFIQYAWNKARAKEEVGEGSAPYNFDHVNNEEIWGQRRHAERVRTIVGIFGGVFGKPEINRRIRGVLSGVTPDPNGFFVCGRLPGMLAYLKATGGDPKEYVYAISMPAYYGSKSASGEAGTGSESVSQILDDIRAGMEKTKADRTAMVNLAAQYGLAGGYCAYESGPDIGGGRTTNIANRIMAIRDPRQKDLFKMNLADCFWGVGANLAMQFTLCSPYSRYGAWGLTDDTAHPDRNSLFQAARELIGAGH
jgi:hypothetical protein